MSFLKGLANIIKENITVENTVNVVKGAVKSSSELAIRKCNNNDNISRMTSDQLIDYKKGISSFLNNQISAESSATTLKNGVRKN